MSDVGRTRAAAGGCGTLSSGVIGRILRVAAFAVAGVLVLSFHRDLWVRIDGHRRHAKINSALDDSPQALIDTVEELSGIPIHHYVEVDFSGFRSLVDTVGGIDVCLERAIYDSTLRF